jgi:hypothetical protein
VGFSTSQERLIGTDQRNVQRDCLRQDDAIPGIAVVD